MSSEPTDFLILLGFPECFVLPGAHWLLQRLQTMPSCARMGMRTDLALTMSKTVNIEHRKIAMILIGIP
jgi:hypothetical protein